MINVRKMKVLKYLERLQEWFNHIKTDKHSHKHISKNSF